MTKDSENGVIAPNDQLQQAISHFTAMGFTTKVIWQAWKNTNQRQSMMLDEIIKLSSENPESGSKLISDGQQQSLMDSDNSQIKRAISLSLNQFQQECNSEDFIRSGDNPVGLANLGRTCYFNVVIQTLFSIKELREIILGANVKSLDRLAAISSPPAAAAPEKQKLFRLVEEFQTLFGAMIAGKKSFSNPRKVFEGLRDFSGGSCFQIGEENDFWEFQNATFDSLEKAFQQLEGGSGQDSLAESSASLFISSLLPLSTKEQGAGAKQKTSGGGIGGRALSSNPMTNLFYGKAQETISYSIAGKRGTKVNESTQGIISLEVKHASLLNALDATQKFEIPDYEVTEGVKTNAKVETKFLKAPEILNFYINRLDFDRKNMCTVKMNDQFYFEKELDISSFSVSKQPKVGGGNNDKDEDECNKLSRQISKLDEKRRECFDLENNTAPIKLNSCFEGVLSFLAKQVAQKDEFIDFDDFEMDVDDKGMNLESIGSKQELETTMKILSQYQNQIASQSERLNKKLAVLQKQRLALFKKQKRDYYQLFSILMHEGSASSGHYYCYIFNESKSKWYKYNDSTVSEAVEEDLMKEAFGNAGSTKNACSLFYRLKKDGDSSSTSDSKSEESLSVQKANLPVGILKRVQELDKQFFDEIDVAKVMRSFEPLKRFLAKEVAQRYSLMNQSTDSLACIEPLLNLENFLLNLESYRQYGVREILISMIGPMSSHNNLEKSLRDPSNLGQGIEALFKSFEKLFVIPSYLKMAEVQENELVSLKQIHSNLLGLTQELQWALASLERIESFPAGISSLGAILFSIRDTNKSVVTSSVLAVRINEAASYMLKVQLLKGCFNIDCKLQRQSNVGNISQFLNSIMLSLITFFPHDAMLKQQIVENLRNTLASFGANSRLCSPELASELKQSVDRIPLIEATHSMNKNNMRDMFKFKCSVKEDMIKLEAEQKKEIIVRLVKTWNERISDLQVWRQFLDKITSSKKVIPLAERLDQEEILYSTQV